MRTKAGIALLSLLVTTAAGCFDSRAENSRWIYLCKDTLAPEAASELADDGRDGPMEARRPAVLFVAYVATPHDVVDAMLNAGHVTERDVVYDLGCGDGRIVVTAAKRYGCRAVGYDLDRLRVQEARKSVQDNHVADLVRIEQADVLHVDLSEATVITLYLGPELNARLIPQLAKLGPGVRIVSHDFGLADIPPDKVASMTSRTDHQVHTIYLWNCPLKTVGQAHEAVP
ncbi:MAG: class I SAM-dependent methyltransferase [Sedimentisphaerales bacterium]|nr:class I SAM-dependent methyltransferase [Sedimentisphaerales bacterium]